MKKNNFFLIFLQGLDKIAHKHDISLLVDEVQTGGGSTGKMWCHEHFDMEHGPGKHLYLLPAIIQLKNLCYVWRYNYNTAAISSKAAATATF